MADLNIDLEAIRSVGDGLHRIAREFDGANAHSDRIADAVGHSGLSDAVRSFAHAWDDTRADMTGQITGLGDAASAIAEQFTGADANLAAALEDAATDSPDKAVSQ